MKRMLVLIRTFDYVCLRSRDRIAEVVVVAATLVAATHMEWIYIS